MNVPIAEVEKGERQLAYPTDTMRRHWVSALGPSSILFEDDEFSDQEIFSSRGGFLSKAHILPNTPTLLASNCFRVFAACCPLLRKIGEYHESRFPYLLPRLAGSAIFKRQDSIAA